jgi:hypothetical protein
MRVSIMAMATGVVLFAGAFADPAGAMPGGPASAGAALSAPRVRGRDA